MVAKTAIYLAALAAAAHSVAAHTIVTSVWVNGKDTADAGVGVGSSYMRTPSSNSPVKDLSSPNMACNDRGTTPVSGFLKVAPGDVIEPEWWHSGARGEDPIATSHVGPLESWISPYDANTKGDVWVQISSEAYDKDSSQWAVEKMIANKGRNKVVVPKDIAPGKYIVQFNLYGMHEAQSVGGGQWYPNCAQVEVTGSGSTKLPSGVAIPGFYTGSTPGVVWDIYYSSTYDTKLDYIAPGTGVWDGSATYSTDVCHEKVYGLAPAGYCQGSNNSTAPVKTSAAATTSKAPATTSKAGSTSAVASSATTTKVAQTTSKAAYTTPASSPAAPSSAPAGTTTSSAPDSQYTDYNSCMRAYNKCLDAHQPKNGGAADFSACQSMNCQSYQRMARRSARHAARH
ncbi:Glycoside hydrolase family 61 protein [Rhodotorula toruloides ATCC 204091]|uniref:AA9 family lytic polysaccharide monooxygenase n=1 Tax=Rhodotorula toruloides TaxID=5286 RepID=A0A0K3CDZ6_RHOTO|nr:Glycoside hydrolase family 61 protein [Rhodotorula toruloides ATCC 204091]PRQ74952.1 Glycosyl hydrolase family 61-domain containing protein [Rhodotorula toruloides]